MGVELEQGCNCIANRNRASKMAMIYKRKEEN